MTRKIRNWNPEPVANFTVAPHRYLYSGTTLADGTAAKWLHACENWTECKANIPYKRGEVVYIDRNGKAVKALILDVLPERDRYGDRRECYHVAVETASGHWSKLWECAYSGYIQRGYQRAGLAPDVDR